MKPSLSNFAKIVLSVALALSFSTLAHAQANPLPFVSQPLVPVSTAAGGAGFTLTINGGGFVSGAVASWTVGQTRTPLTTAFLSGTKLMATVPASLITTAATATVTVSNPGGLPSGGSLFEIGHSASSVAFLAPVILVTGQNPNDVVTGDFNDDGNLDIATANFTDGSVSIFLGNGDGTFQARKDYPAGGAANWLAVGDFNGDGRPDLVVANNFSSGTVSVLLGNGDGSFQAPATYAAGTAPQTLVVGDFNQDGRLDVAASCGNTNICVLLGNSDGTLQSQMLIGTPDGALGLMAGDFNGDGKLDLAATTSSRVISVLLGNGDGTFQTPIEYPALGGGFEVTTADFNRDEKLDLTFVFFDGVGLLLGNGDGSFQPAQNTIFSSASPNVAVAGDFNGDGLLDLAVAGNGSMGFLSIALGKGDATFQTPVYYPAGTASGTIALGDFNGDGLLDAVTTNYLASTISVLLQTTGTVTPISLSFGTVGLGTPSTQNVNLSNIGVMPLPVGPISFSGFTPQDFSQTNNCGSSLAAGVTCAVSVTFTPRAKQNRAATMTITTGTAGNQQFQVTLTGTGAFTTFIITPPRGLNFGNQTVGTTSASQTITLQNTGPIALGITKVVLGGQNAGDFALVNNCPATLAARTSCTVNATFTPKQLGTRRGAVGFHLAGAGTVSVPMRGVGD